MRFPVVGAAEDVAPGCTCHYALCRHDAEYRVSLPRQEAMLVCSLHVTPVVTWGWSDEDDFPTIEALAG